MLKVVPRRYPRDRGKRSVANAYKQAVLGVFWIITLTVMIFLLSPLVLILVSHVFDVDWNRLSAIGQSYTAVGALLSGGALIAVAVSTRLQARQVATSQFQAMRDLELRILALSTEHPELRLLVDPALDVELSRRADYIAMQFLFWEFAFSSGHVTSDGLRSTLEHQYFNIAAVRDYWDERRSRFRYQASTETRNQFADIVDEEYEEACKRYSAVNGVAGYAVIVEQAHDGGYAAWSPELPGCVARGSTIEECLAEMRRAIAVYVDMLREHGEEAPQPRSVEVVTLPTAHRKGPTSDSTT